MGHATKRSVTVGIVAIASLGACSDAEVAPPAPTPAFVSGSRLRANLLDGGDGAVVFEGWQDTTLEEPCRFRVASDGVWRCLLEDESTYVHDSETDILFLDAACADPVRLVRPDAPRIPRWVLGEPGTGTRCDVDDRSFPVFELAEELQPTELFWRLGDECEPFGPPDPMYMRVFALGPELAPAELVAARLIQEPRTEDLAASLFAGEDGSREVFDTFDRGRAMACNTLWLDSGACIPVLASWSVGDFADATCSEPTAYTSAMVPNGAADSWCPGPYVAIQYDFEGCQDTFSFFEVGPEVEDVYRLDEAGVCGPYDDGGHANYRVGASIPNSAFPQLARLEVGSGRLRARWFSDGAAPLYAIDDVYVDSQLDMFCTPTEMCDGTIVCVPQHVSTELFFTDGTCRGEPVIQLGTDECNPHTFVNLSSWNNGCVEDGKTHAIGAKVAAPSLWSLDPSGACVSAFLDETPGVAVYQLGDEVPWSSYARLERRTE